MPGSVTTALTRATALGSRAASRGSPAGALAVLAGALLQLPDAAARPAASFDRVDGVPPPDRSEFHFTRAVYSAFRFRNWAIDYPKADRQLMTGVRRLLTDLDA